MPKRKPVTFEMVRRLALAFPAVEEGISTNGICASRRIPGPSFTTDHYRGYPTVLVRLATVDPGDLRDVLEQAWRLHAPKRLLATHDRSQ